MKAPYSWIAEYADLPADLTPEALADQLTHLGLKLEALHTSGITGPLVVGRVLTREPEPQKNGKTINWCTVDVGEATHGIVCGAHNFAPDDLVVVALPGTVLPGGFEISARKTYGHVSDGMICSAAELGLSGDADGIIVLPSGSATPGDPAVPLLGLDEVTIEFEINPDRAYALSLRGIAREAALATGGAYRDPADRPLPAPNADGYPVEVADAVGCPVFVTREVSGFDPTRPTPDWMVRRLEQCGMRSISLAVDISNWVMLELGNPNHAYDRDKLSGPIQVRRAKPGESLVTLDDVRRELDPADLVIADDSGPIGLAGVMGGASTEISDSTTSIVIEAAHFDPVTVFGSQRRHKLGSEASKRFERGVDPLLPEAAADRVAELLVAHGGGEISAGVTKVGQAPAPTTIELASDLTARVTGLDVSHAEVVAKLEAIGADVRDEGDRLSVTAPSWRPDLGQPVDLVEEVARQVGYENVPGIVPRAAAGHGWSRSQQLRRRVGNLLAGAGLTEVLTFPFLGDEALDALGIAPEDPRRDFVLLENPLSAAEPGFATTLVPGLLKTAARNLGRGAPGVSLYEIASVARRTGTGPAPILPTDRRPTEAEYEQLLQALPDQPVVLTAVFAGTQEDPGWQGPGRVADWTDAIATVRTLAGELGVEVAITNTTRAPWHPGRCAELAVAGEVIGTAGELHPRAARNFDLPTGTAVLELDLDRLFDAVPLVRNAPVLSSHAVAKEDVALVVADQVPAAEVAAALTEGAGELLESVRLFDIYTGDQIPPGSKSLAFALRFRAPDRTLTDAEVAEARDAAVAKAVERLGAEQRA